MEDWSFPPKYNEDYIPPENSRYWFPKRETMPAGDRDKLILERLKVVCAYAYAQSSFYRRKWDEAGFHPSHLRSLEDFEAKVPVVTKSDLRTSQAAAPPFGDYLCVPEGEIFHVHGTSGTTGRPTAFGIGRNDWAAISNAHARIMWGMGIRPTDMVCVAAILSLYMGSWGALAGAERLRAKSFPFGAGAPGMSVRCAQWLDSMKPAAFYGTPTYALHLAQTAIDDGLDPRKFGLRVMFFSGEPGASIPGVRDKIADLYGAQVFDCGSMAEMSPFMNVAGTAETSGLLCWQDVVYTEVCDPKTMHRVPFGARGTPVYTHLERTSQPMIRLASGDLTVWTNEANPCGRTYPRLPNGIFGRIDDMFTIRGENIYPSEIDAVLNEMATYGGEHQVIISRDAAMDELLLRVEVGADVMLQADAAARRATFKTDVAGRMQKTLGLRTVVEVIDHGVLPRTDFKARRVIDDRAVFRDLNQQIAERQGDMSAPVPSLELLERAKAGHVAAIGRLISRAEAATNEVRPALAEIYKCAGGAHVIGITGVPGSGKSTLVARLATMMRTRGHRVGIIAIDPSSPYSGGAILGDRIRMTDLALDTDVFIRSMATRGAMGGMARAALDAVDILDVAGYDTIIIETVGVGQDEVEIAKASQTTVVVSAPGLGDEVQAIKAGMLEIADVHVVSKCDRSDAHRTVADLKSMMTMAMAHGPVAEWRVPVLGISSYSGEGFDAFIDAVERHRAVTSDVEKGRSRRLAIARFRLLKTSENLLIARFLKAAETLTEDFAVRLEQRDTDPYSSADELVARAVG